MPCLAQPYEWWETHFVLGWDDSGEKHSGSQSTLHMPELVRVLRLHPLPSRCCLGVQWTSMVIGKDGCLERTLFWKALLTVNFLLLK